jgi:hypothetical protein
MSDPQDNINVFFIISVVTLYTATLASKLTMLKLKCMFDGIDDIKNGKIPFSCIGIFVEATVED